MLIIRADGNAKIGAGHLMRCLTIAAECKEEVIFFCADRESADFAIERGAKAKVLHSDYQNLESEFPEGAKSPWDLWITSKENTILVDSYYVTDAYLERLKQYGKVVLMDDLQEHTYPVDGVINYNVFASEEKYHSLYAGKDTACYLGGKYVPVRKQFQDAPYIVRNQVKQVLITTGGGDVDNIAGQIWEAIYRKDLIFHVLVGRFSPHFEKWQQLAKNHENLQIHFDVKDMASLMEACDLAITAGGSTIYELSAVGVPFICFSYAKNQEALVEYVGEQKIAGSAGAWHLDREACLKKLQELFGQLCTDIRMRENYFKKERILIDGLGAERIAEVLTHLENR